MRRYQWLVLLAMAGLGAAAQPGELTERTHPVGGLPPGFRWDGNCGTGFISIDEPKVERPQIFVPDDAVKVFFSPGGPPEPVHPEDRTLAGEVGGRPVTWFITGHRSGTRLWLEYTALVVSSEWHGPGWNFGVTVKIMAASEQAAAVFRESLKTLSMSD